MKAPASPTSEVFTSVSNVAPRRLQAIDLNALGTQVGSEGVKAPKPPASSEAPAETDAAAGD